MMVTLWTYADKSGTTLRDAIAEGSHDINIETITLFVLLFADDVVIFAETVIELQCLFNIFAVHI